MNVDDISYEEEVFQTFDFWLSQVKEADSWQGRAIPSYPSRDELISSHTASVHSNGALNESTTGTDTQTCDLDLGVSMLLYPYLPCVRRVVDLTPIFIKQMRLQIHHRGYMTLVRVLTPSERTAGIITIVEDEQGTVLTLQARHQPLNVPHEEYMKPDDVFLLKEPYLVKEASSGTEAHRSYRLRVDHLCDIVKLPMGDERIPKKWMRQPHASSQALRTQGNETAEMKQWAKAHRLYTSAIEAAGENPEDRRLAHLNRSMVNLQLGRPEHARKDAKHGSNISPPPAKGVFREALALYELEDFAQSLKCLESLSEFPPKDKPTKRLVKRIKARLREQEEGVYDFLDMHRQANQTTPLVDCATYSAPVEVRPSPGRGNGLFTKVAVSAGQLLVCEKAFSYSCSTPETAIKLLNISTGIADEGGQAELLSALIDKLHHGSRQMRESFGELHREQSVATPPEAEDTPVVDSFRVANIMSLNCMGAPPNSRPPYWSSEIWEQIYTQYSDTRTFGTCGLWLLASRINHSCIGNCRQSFIGDAQIIRATRDLEAGSELVFEYVPPKPGQAFPETQASLYRWDFECSCELCLSRPRKYDGHLEAHRKRLAEKVIEIRLLPVKHEHDLSEAKRHVLWLEKSYPPGALSFTLWSAYWSLGITFSGQGKPADCIETIAKGLRTVGFQIEVVTPGKGKTPLLNVKQWGYVNPMTPEAFFLLFKSYKQLAPEVCNTAKRYTVLAYSMVLGEQETLGDKYPDLEEDEE